LENTVTVLALALALLRRTVKAAARPGPRRPRPYTVVLAWADHALDGTTRDAELWRVMATGSTEAVYAAYAEAARHYFLKEGLLRGIETQEELELLGMRLSYELAVLDGWGREHSGARCHSYAAR